MDLQKIQQNSLAGFLQDAIRKQVQKESEVEHAFDPRPELPPYEKPKFKKDTVWWWNFSKNLINQLNP